MKNSTWYKNSVAVIVLATTLDLSAMKLSRFATYRCIVPTVAALAYGYRAIKPITLFAENSDLKKQKSHEEIGAVAAQAGVKLALMGPEEYAWRVQKKQWNEAYQLNKMLQDLYCGITVSERSAACRTAEETTKNEVMWHALDPQRVQKIAADGIAETQVLREYAMPSAEVAENYGVRAAILCGTLTSHTVVPDRVRDTVAHEHQAARAILEKIQSAYCAEISFECTKARAYGSFLAHTSQKSGLSQHNTAITQTRILVNELTQLNALPEQDSSPKKR